MACDAETYYMLDGIPYLGKGSTPADRLQGEYFATSLTQRFANTGRIVTTDSWFTSIPLVDALQRNGLHLVGTITKKKELPLDILSTKMEVKESMAVFNHKRNLTLQCTRIKPGCDCSSSLLYIMTRLWSRTTILTW